MEMQLHQQATITKQLEVVIFIYLMIYLNLNKNLENKIFENPHKNLHVTKY